MDENAHKNFHFLSHNFLNNCLISKIQSSAESAGLSTSDNPSISLIRTNSREQTGADYWKFTVLIYVYSQNSSTVSFNFCSIKGSFE